MTFLVILSACSLLPYHDFSCTLQLKNRIYFKQFKRENKFSSEATTVCTKAASFCGTETEFSVSLLQPLSAIGISLFNPAHIRQLQRWIGTKKQPQVICYYLFYVHSLKSSSALLKNAK